MANLKVVYDPPSICSISDCHQFRYKKQDWCVKHYTRWRRSGDPLGLKSNTGGGPNKPRYEIRYRTAHMHVAKMWGHANKYSCVDCGAPAKHWAYDGADPTEKTELDHRGNPLRFSVWEEFYKPMCVPCHFAHDTEMWEKAWQT